MYSNKWLSGNQGPELQDSGLAGTSRSNVHLSAAFLKVLFDVGEWE